MPFFGGGGGTTPVNMVGASTGTAGTAGYVPAPAAGKNTRALFSDGSFGELPLLPQYKTANTNNIPTWLADSGTGYTPTIKVRYFSLVYCPADGAINTLVSQTSTAPSPAFNVNLAIWDCGEDGLPSTYIAGANVSSGTLGFSNFSASISSTTIKRGFYWGSVTTDATGSSNALRRVSAPNVYKSFLGGGNLDGNINNLNYTTTTYDQITHAASFTLAIAGPIPLFGFRYT